MILYRCTNTVPVGIIPASNWAVHSIALEVFLDMCEERVQAGGGDKIIVIELPRPNDELVGEYKTIYRREAVIDVQPFGLDEKRGWWSFNRPYSGSFKVIDVLERKGYSLEQIDYFDLKYKTDRAEWAPWLRDNVVTIQGL